MGKWRIQELRDTTNQKFKNILCGANHQSLLNTMVAGEDTCTNTNRVSTRPVFFYESMVCQRKCSSVKHESACGRTGLSEVSNVQGWSAFVENACRNQAIAKYKYVLQIALEVEETSSKRKASKSTKKIPVYVTE
ncbi:hypothetical protein G9A89_004252 [Geosiphon pyriformis]|nr:hypothetical protein G9A89_004252 [Geosiphon pyriformis]